MKKQELEKKKEQELKALIEKADLYRFKIDEYKTMLKSVQNQIRKFPRCKQCCKSFVSHQLRRFTANELKSIEDQEDQEADNDSCFSRLNEDDLYCSRCISRALQPA